MKKKHRIILVALAAFYAANLIWLGYSSLVLRSRINALSGSLSGKDWRQSEKILNDSSDKLKNIKKSLVLFFPFNQLPLVRDEVKIIRSFLDSGILLAQIGEEFTGWISENKDLARINFLEFASLSAPEKEIVLTALADAARVWRERQDEITEVKAALARQAGSSRLPIIKRRINDSLTILSSFLDFFEDFEPWLENIPGLLGYPEEKTYLLLLQNNTELRPTGGFIGTFGVLKISSGEITDFYTENVYNLDEPAKKFNDKIPPLPLQKYILQKQWFFRDSNWDPDFPASARTAIKFYQDENGKEKKFDGVLAFTPELIKEFLKTTGAAQVKDEIFTADNIVEKLQYEVAIGFTEKGVNVYNRKLVIDELAQILKERLYGLTIDQARKLLPRIFLQLDEKHLLLYFNDSQPQTLVEKNNWAGQIKQTEGDYFYVVDANLGSLKTDPAVGHEIDYGLKISDDGNLLARLDLRYKNTGKFDWKTTRYRTYVRVYLPLGAKLLSSVGNEEEISVGEEHGKAVFGTFISIEPGQEETLSYQYSLPAALREKIFKGGYSLYLQKQPGTDAHKIEIAVELPFAIREVSPKNLVKIRDGHIISGVLELKADRQITANN